MNLAPDPGCPDLCDHAALHEELSRRNAALRPDHEHDWVYLRQEEEPAYYGTGKLRAADFYDVFYCRTDPNHPYTRKHVRTEEPSSMNDHLIVTWRAAEVVG